MRITPTGVVTEFSAGITPDSSPLAITTGPGGNLWFTEPNIAKVAYITTAGVVTEINIGPNTNPADIILEPDHNIWFTDLQTGKIGRCLVTY